MTWGQNPDHFGDPGTNAISGPPQPPPGAAQPPPGPPQPPQTPAAGYPPTAPQTPYPGTVPPPTPNPYGGQYPPQGPPNGPPPGPHQYGPGPGGPPPRRSSSKAPIVFAITAVLVLMVVGVAVAVVLTRNDPAGASEVFLQPQDQPGPDPFTPTAASEPPAKATVPSTTPAPATGTGGAIQSLPAAQPGLYGGTQNISYCDPPRMIDFLERNPDKAAAWSSVLGISTSQIRTYVGSLTSVLLRSDTRVTNHGYANGRATTINAVLQAGTAVLVDSYGVPRVKCNCGNPLTPPTPLSTPRYTGPTWPGYNITNIIVVQQSVTIINTYTLYDPVTGTDFVRPAGTSGTADAPVGQTSTTTGASTSTTGAIPSSSALPREPSTTDTRPPPVSTTAPTLPPATTTTSSGPPPPTANQVVQVFVQRRAACLQDPSLNWPFKKSNTPDEYSASPTGDPYVFNLTAVNHPPGETQTWTWRYDARTGQLAATNGLAQQANAGCRSLEFGR